MLVLTPSFPPRRPSYLVRAVYFDKISGRRRVEISIRVGDRHPLTSTGLGKALLLDLAPAHWRHLFEDDQARGAPAADYATWERRMRRYVAAGCALDRKSTRLNSSH